jgi:hypothetical protein
LSVVENETVSPTENKNIGKGRKPLYGVRLRGADA